MTGSHFFQMFRRGFTYIALLFVLFFAGLFVFAQKGGDEQIVFVPPHSKEKVVSMLFVGDMMFDRQIRKRAEQMGQDYIFSCASSTLRRYDAVVGNLEGPVTHNKSASEGSVVGSPENFVFTFPLFVPKALFDHNIKIVNLGNNHILNFEVEGLHETRRLLDEAGVSYFGGVAGNTSVLRSEFNGREFSFISFNEFGGESASSTVELIQKEKTDGQTVIVYAHWGDEYVEAPLRVHEWTRQFIRAGADVVLGSHPHVVQSWGRVDGKPYYFSLGNFIFDQYWSEEVSQGLAVEAVFDGEQITTQEFNVQMHRDGRSCIEPML